MSRPTPASQLPPYLAQALTSPDYLYRAFIALDVRESQRRKHMSHSTHSFRLPSSSDAHKRFSIKVGNDLRNRTKNRYAGSIVPYDWNRAVGVGEGKDEYVNASWVREVHGGKWWCAAQAPMPESFHAFLSLCTHPLTIPTSSAPPSRIPSIIQLTRDVESRMRKAHPYIPQGSQTECTIPPPDPSLPPITIRVLSRAHLSDSQTLHTRLLLNGAFEVSHYLYEGWPDHGVPPSPVPLLALARLVDDTVPVDTPVLVHCSAGIGRTGTFIALCSLLRHYGVLRRAPGDVVSVTPLEPLLGALDQEWAEDAVVREIDGLRDQRTGMVQRQEQVEWIYATVAQVLLSKTQDAQGSE